MSGPGFHRSNPQFAQRRGHGVTTFELQAGALKYSELAGKAEPASETVPWSKTPPPFEYLESADTRFVPWVLIAGLAAAWPLVLANNERAVLAACFAAMGYLIVCAAAWIASRSNYFRRTSIRCGDVVVTILHDQNHDEIMQGIARARATFLRRFATVDPNLTAAENLRKLRRLVELEVITPHEFDLAQAQLAPGQPSYLPVIDTEPPVTFQQKRFFTECSFSLHRDYFVYSYSDLNRRLTRKLRYLRLPSLDRMEPARINALAAVIMGGWLMLFVCATLLQILNMRPDLQLAGLNGLRLGIPVFGPLIACAAMVCMCAGLLSSIACMKLADHDLIMMRDSKQERIVAELTERRRAAAKALAEDPLLHPAEQKAMLLRLHKAGMLSDGELDEHLIEAIQQHGFQEPPAPSERQPRPGPAATADLVSRARARAQTGWRRGAASPVAGGA